MKKGGNTTIIYRQKAILDFIILFGIIISNDVICVEKFIDHEQEIETLQSE